MSSSEVSYLLSLRSIRERAKIIGEAAQAGKLHHFDIHDERMGEVADFVTSVVKVCPNKQVWYLVLR